MAVIDLEVETIPWAKGWQSNLIKCIEQLISNSSFSLFLSQESTHFSFQKKDIYSGLQVVAEQSRWIWNQPNQYCGQSWVNLEINFVIHMSFDSCMPGGFSNCLLTFVTVLDIGDLNLTGDKVA